MNREILQQALNALDNLGSMSDHDVTPYAWHGAKAEAACAALREALAAPEPEPVAWYLPSPDGDDSIFRDHRTVVACTGNKWEGFLPLYAAPPAAPADDHATPSGGQEAGPQEDRIEAAYWRFDARHKGYSQWKTAPMSERDAFKAEMRNALEAEKVRAEMRLVARGWRRPDAPAAPAPAAPVPDGWVMVPREPTPEMLAVVRNGPMHETWTEGYCAMIAASPAAPVVREPLRDDAFHAWVEEASADHPNLLERQEFRDAMYNAWINGYNTRVDEQAHGITGASK